MMIALLAISFWVKLGAVWVLACFLFCVAWAGLMRAVKPDFEDAPDQEKDLSRLLAARRGLSGGVSAPMEVGPTGGLRQNNKRPVDLNLSAGGDPAPAQFLCTDHRSPITDHRNFNAH
jgi:hypothetical protein